MVWLNPDLKVFSTEIYFDDDAVEVRTGMSCQVEIIVEEYADELYVPLQAVLRVGGKPTVYVAGSGGSEPREVELGLDNNRMVRIVSGLKEGEKVLLAPPLSPSEIVNGLAKPPSAVEGQEPKSGKAGVAPQRRGGTGRRGGQRKK
jgi:HlyD family secretion protein